MQYKINEEVIHPVQQQSRLNFILFLSIGNNSIRAQVYKTISTDFRKAFSRVRDKLIKFVKKHHLKPEWLKVDIVTQIESIPFKTLEAILQNSRKNYFR